MYVVFMNLPTLSIIPITIKYLVPLLCCSCGSGDVAFSWLDDHLPNYEKFYVQTHQLRSSILPEGKFFSYLLFTPLTSLWHCLMYEVSVSYRRRAFALKDTLSNLSYAKDRVITYVSSKDFTIRSLSNPILLDNPKRCIFL